MKNSTCLKMGKKKQHVCCVFCEAQICMTGHKISTCPEIGKRKPTPIPNPSSSEWNGIMFLKFLNDNPDSSLKNKPLLDLWLSASCGKLVMHVFSIKTIQCRDSVLLWCELTACLSLDHPQTRQDKTKIFLSWQTFLSNDNPCK